MKKILVLAVLVFIGISASSQVRYSRIMAEKKSNTVWYLRAGAGFNSLGGDVSDASGYEVSGKTGYEVAFGFNKGIGKSGAYWGMELGLSNRGFKIDREDNGGYFEYTGHNVKFVPLMFGYKFSLTEDLKLDAHLGGYVSYDFTGSEDYESLYSDIFPEELDAGLQVGVGVWYKRVNLDLTYQRGFMNACDDYSVSGNMSAFMIRLGFSF